MDTRLIQTSHYYGQLNKDEVEVEVDSLLCPWDLEALTFSLNLTLLIQTLPMAPSVSVLLGFECTLASEIFYAYKPTLQDTALTSRSPVRVTIPPG